MVLFYSMRPVLQSFEFMLPSGTDPEAVARLLGAAFLLNELMFQKTSSG
jgi:hypothetical protein